MAANDYYNTSYSSHAAPDPNKPLPAGAQSQQSISPVTSPFDDHNRFDYNSSQQHLASGGAAPAGYKDNDTSYQGAGSVPQRYDPPVNQNYQNDPFADQNAIPLQNQAKMGTTYSADPEGRLYEPGHGVQPKKKKGLFNGRVTWVVYILTAAQIGTFVGELIRNGILTGTPIQLKPSFNYMIGPSQHVLINMGARYSPCMHNIRTVTDSAEPMNWACPNNTAQNFDAANSCSLPELCGMGGGVPDQVFGTPFNDRSHEPNQWWRFITAMFLHAGVIHIAFNMLLQLTLGRDMEKELGSLRFALVYFSAGIFGFVLGGNYANPAQPSVGASGALFGILALVLLDLLYNWSSRRSPVKDLLFLLLDIAIAFVLGLLPFLDNFAHIGGFLCGLVLGICLMHSPQALRERIGVDQPPYATVDTQPLNGSNGKPAIASLVKKPVGFFKGRKPLWWAWWLVRAGALVAVFVGFILLLQNFYTARKDCSWCHRLSCLPVKDWCKTDFPKDSLKVVNDTNNAPSRMVRDVLYGLADLSMEY
ncbi:rhomboid family membrane protein [Dendryphion nanum]|uniref:Rhomboid-type serine protease n=1 Tax=Dendryphion nanum TaxID=256645 RepID=A0A9P9E6X7_9PLEO|nr:rhomboid family membrane protein [Dendryphion nanum]